MKGTDIFLVFSIVCVVVATMIYLVMMFKAVNLEGVEMLVMLDFDKQTAYFFMILVPLLIANGGISFFRSKDTLNLVYSMSFILFALLAGYVGIRKKALTSKGIGYTAFNGRLLQVIEWENVLDWHWSYDNNSISMIVRKGKRKLNLRWSIPESQHSRVDGIMNKHVKKLY